MGENNAKLVSNMVYDGKCTLDGQHPPPPRSLSIHGASKGVLGMAGGGGNIREYRGTFIRAFSANFDNSSTYKANISQEMGMSKLELQMDNKACVEVI